MAVAQASDRGAPGRMDTFNRRGDPRAWIRDFLDRALRGLRAWIPTGIHRRVARASRAPADARRRPTDRALGHVAAEPERAGRPSLAGRRSTSRHPRTWTRRLGH